MKINIAFLAPTEGIGGTNRKFLIYYKNMDNNLFNKYYIYLNPDDTCLKQIFEHNFYSIGKQRLLDFIKEKKIHFFYQGRSINENLRMEIKKHCYILQNVNFTQVYKKDPKIINFIISMTDYYKIKWLYGRIYNSHVVYNPIDLQKWERLSKEIEGKYSKKLSKKKLIIGRLARAEPSKWNFLILKTLKKLDIDKNYNYGFIFAGMPNLYKAWIKLFLSKRMKQGILLLPELTSDKDLAEFYKSIDLFWQTSHIGESFGNVIAEAFCFDVPVMSDYKDFFRKNGSVNKKWYNAQSELVDHDKNGAICNYPSKVIEFLEKNNKQSLKYLGKNGHEKVKNNYDARLAGNTMAKILYKYLRKNNLIPKDEKYEALKIIPSQNEVNKFAKVYIKKLEEEKKANSIPKLELLSYKVQEKIWNVIEFIYLAIRKVFRFIKIDIERW